MSYDGQAQSPYGNAGSTPAGAPGAVPPGYGYANQPYPGYAPAPQYGAPAGWAGQPPSNNIGWAIGALVLFWPLCIPAFIASTKVSDLWFTGRHQEALQASADAKRWGKLGIIIGASITGFVVLVYIAMFAFMIIGAGAMSSY